MAVSNQTVTDIVTRTLGALRGLTGDEELRARASELERVLQSFVEDGFIQPDAKWLMCELCKALGAAAELLKSAGKEALAAQIKTLVLADALFVIATESHFVASRHPNRERMSQMIEFSDEIRGAASRAGMLLTLPGSNVEILKSLNQQVIAKTSKVGALQKLVTNDPYCDHSVFGPTFARVQQYLPTV